MGDNNTELQQERREARRRRRKRNQFLAYLVVVLFILLIAFGIVEGVQYLTQMANVQEQQKVEQQSKVEDILKSEEVIEAPESTEEYIEPVVELTPEQKLDEIVNAAIEVMPIEDKVAGLFIVSPEAITGVDAAVKAGDGTRDALATYAVGGVVYSKKNIVDKDQLKELLDNTTLYSKYPLFLAINEEGGSNSVVAGAGLADATDSEKALGESGDVNAAIAAATAVGTYLQEYGFNLNLAPVADVVVGDNSVLGKRSFGESSQKVSPFVNAVCNAYEAQKVTACAKYFPGMGSVTESTEKGKASTERTLDEFRNEEFQVYKGLVDAGVNMVMVGNFSAPSLTGDNTPCCMAESVVSLLRDEIGYQGVIISAPLNEKAVTEYYASDEAAIKALKANCDMILMPEDFEAAYNGILQAVKEGTIDENRIDNALRRIYRIKFADRIEQ